MADPTHPNPPRQQPDSPPRPGVAHATGSDDPTDPARIMGGHDTITGSARGVGSTRYDELGAFDVGAEEERSFQPSSGPLETGYDDRTEAERASRDPGDATDRLSPETARPEGAEAAEAERWGAKLAQRGSAGAGTSEGRPDPFGGASPEDAGRSGR